MFSSLVRWHAIVLRIGKDNLVFNNFVKDITLTNPLSLHWLILFPPSVSGNVSETEFKRSAISCCPPYLFEHKHSDKNTGWNSRYGLV